MPKPKSDARALLSEKMRSHRSARGLSQEALAALVGLHRTYIGSVERGERNVSLDNLERIANALNMSLAELFTEDLA
jgi:transcriptional regulator with XRE-family HTH domain